MKKIIALCILLTFCQFSFSQLIQATIKNSPQPGKFRLAIRPNAPVSGAISSVTFTIAIPSSIVPKPFITVSPIAAGLTYVVGEATEPDNLANNYYSYAVVFDGNSALSLIANQELDIADMEFGGATGTTTARLSNFPDGGADLNHQFYIAIGGADRTNYPQPFYGPGATNNGGGLGTYSFVPLNGVTLPVKFASFFAYKQNNDGLLNWSVENQNADVKLFEIERSFNGTSFTKIAQQNPTLTTNGTATYNLSDVGVFDNYKGTVYYRIKQVDFNGQITYSSIKSIKADSKGYALNLYPNPAIENVTVTFSLEKASQVTITLLDITGKKIMDYPMQAQKGINQKQINVSNLANGNYSFKLSTANDIQTIPFVKNN